MVFARRKDGAAGKPGDVRTSIKRPERPSPDRAPGMDLPSDFALWRDHGWGNTWPRIESSGQVGRHDAGDQEREAEEAEAVKDEERARRPQVWLAAQRRPNVERRNNGPGDKAESDADSKLAPFPNKACAGAISLSSSSHFTVMSYSYSIKPVALPPDRVRLSTKPAPTVRRPPRTRSVGHQSHRTRAATPHLELRGASTRLHPSER